MSTGRLQDWLDGLDVSAPGPEAGSDEVAEARRVIEEAARLLGADPPAVLREVLPLVVDKRVAADLVACEAYTMATAGPASQDEHDMVEWPRLRGAALDAYVTHVTFCGAVVDPVADALGMWWALEGTPPESMDDHRDAQLADPDRSRELAELAAATADLVVDSAWTPRVEVALGSTFAGSLRVAGRVDLLLGGPGTGRPAVAVEVKSGALRGEHRAELHHYALLCALRHQELPAGLALWSPGSLQVVPVPGAALAAAHRVADVACALAELWQGRPPRRGAGARCGWCPEADRCDVALGAAVTGSA